MITQKPIKATIVVNRHVVARNKKASKHTGTVIDDPALSVRTSRGVVYGKTIDIKGSSRLVQDAANARCSGATIWLETTFQDLTIDGKKACLSMLPQKFNKEVHKKEAIVIEIANRMLDVSNKTVDKNENRVLEGNQYRIEQSPHGIAITSKERGTILSLKNHKIVTTLTPDDMQNFANIARTLDRKVKQMQAACSTNEHAR